MMCNLHVTRPICASKLKLGPKTSIVLSAGVHVVKTQDVVLELSRKLAVGNDRQVVPVSQPSGQ